MRPKICVSGGFDPLHVGHLHMFKAAAQIGDLYVIINSDEWLFRKKGKVFMPWRERAEIIAELQCVTAVSPVDDSDGTVCEALKRIQPEYFANGGDRVKDNTPEGKVCSEYAIQMLFNIGGEKIASSSEMLDKYAESS